MDLDQALHIERAGDGYRVRYAIADVPAFVRAGGAVDAETRRRGQTIYAPDQRTPLHPPVLSEDAASLLAGQTRPAFVWDMTLEADGEGTDVSVYRAMVRSTDRLDYEGVQKAIDDGSADERLLLLQGGRPEADRVRASAGRGEPADARAGGRPGRPGHYRLYFRPPLEVEDWNAQISLMTGMAAAEMMMKAKVGILRTMPAPDRTRSAGSGTPAGRSAWSGGRGRTYGEFLRSLDRTDPKHLALIHEATALFRGAGYTPFDGELPEQTEHAAVPSLRPRDGAAAPARGPVRPRHLRGGRCGAEVPAWAREALPSLPEVMAASDKVASGVERPAPTPSRPLPWRTGSVRCSTRWSSTSARRVARSCSSRSRLF